MKYLMMLVIFGSCGLFPSRGKIVIQNSAGLSFDSLVVELNDFRFTTPRIENGQIFEIEFMKSAVRASHDVVYFVVIHTKNRKVTRAQFSNDLGYVPDVIRFSINDSLQIVPQNVK